ncbi:penicillin-binding protein 1A [Blattabacterium cuenoti]|uniref:penicillin-binding protein 1A n=1 Tax=Blattabacterium cuenoti TaxID=1653831 RepID=UPI00163BE625|nr:transglycosylase domain-containing protein [Blattabacterium cuenoti]
MNKKKLIKNSYFQILFIYFWFLFFLSISIIFTIIYAASKGYLGNLPTAEDIDNPKIEIGSEVYDYKKKLLGKFFSENRILVSYKQLPKNLVNALLAKEDIRFRQHSGIDMKSIFRAILSLGRKGGGSTITQQLAKLLFTGKSAKNKIQRIHQKILEWVVAIELEKRYTKEEIITMYCNKFDFLYNAKGIQIASQTYFNKKIHNLNLGECATLIGMFENPSFFNPKNYPYRAKKQRNLVLRQMKKYNFLNENRYNYEIQKPIKINFKIHKNNYELLTYYGEFLKNEIQKYLDKYEEKTGKKLNFYSSGLKIYTTIDSKMQEYAEKSIKKHLKYLQSLFNNLQKNNKNAPFSNISQKKVNRILFSSIKRTHLYKILKKEGLSEKNIIKRFKKKELTELFTWNGTKKIMISPLDYIRYKKSIIQTGLLSVETSTGHIKAWVGGVNFNHFKYDNVSQTRRQVGSIFKPILYAAAIKKFNYNPCTKISNEKFELNNWSPKNYDEKYGGFITLKDGLAWSVNTVSARLISQVTPKYVIDLAKKMGVKSDIPENPSIALGSADLTLYEMTGVFNAFANIGIYNEPSLLLKIEDKKGNIINVNKIRKRVLDENVSYIMLDLMQGVVKYGTAKRIKYKYNIKGDIAGKTGTTNDNSDGWFIGMIPKLTTGIWVGWENRFSHFNSLKLGQGANMALPIWAYYTMYLLKDKNFSYNKNMFFKKQKNYKWSHCNNEMNYENYILQQIDKEYDTKKEKYSEKYEYEEKFMEDNSWLNENKSNNKIFYDKENNNNDKNELFDITENKRKEKEEYIKEEEI